MSVRSVACLCVVLWACGDDDSPEPMLDAGSMACESDDDCNDGRFCNGAELCDPEHPSADPLGCRFGDAPCEVGETCFESAEECRPSCVDMDGDGHQPMECGGDDCDDADPERFPGNTEICDAFGHDEDCDAATYGLLDRDGDGFSDTTCCNADNCGMDCDDARRAVSPDATEACDGFDNDCDGSIDEGVLVAGFADADYDLHGDPEAPMMACAGTPGFSSVDDDCDDSNPARHAAQPEFCDDVDNDCDNTVDEAPGAVPWYRDADADGFGSASGGVVEDCEPVDGYSILNGDCDDSLRGINPAAPETCDGLDNDCDGRPSFLIAPGDSEDDDLDGEADSMCPGFGTDCDDDNPLRRPGLVELCDGVDNDCDGEVDGSTADAAWYLDRDRDGFGDDEDVVNSCEIQVGRVLQGGDCDDTDPLIRPLSFDLCDQIDQDCDGELDEGVARTAYYLDDDEDGFGAGMPLLSCVMPPRHVRRPGDCDGANSTANPLAAEQCNGIDDDCDEMIDEDVVDTFYIDDDGDGHGDPDGAVMQGCEAPAGFSALADDCDDANGDRYPTALELCDGSDQDCDDSIDEGDADLACNLTGASARCESGTCFIDMCVGAMADCDANTANGCETDTEVSFEHCGGCVQRCGLGQDCQAASCSSDVVEISGGGPTVGRFFCARRDNGTLVCWGNVPLDDQNQVVRQIPNVTDAISLDAGATHACYVRALGGQVWCFGSDDQGQLGNGGSATDSATPVASLMTGAVQVSAGGNTSFEFTCGRHEDGRVFCWGGNSTGNLGDGTTDNSQSPRPVQGLTDAVDIDAGLTTACAVRATGQVVCWGAGNQGALGNGLSYVGSNVPVTVQQLTMAERVEVGSLSACALQSGSLWCWGDAANGRIPVGTQNDQYSPVEITGLANVTDFSLGEHGGCALVESGETYCWGLNNHCATGTGPDGGNRLDPTEATWAPTFIRLARAGQTTCGIVDGRTVRCWGANDLSSHGIGYGDYGSCSSRGPVLSL